MVMLFWNIAGVRDKLENENVRSWLFQHDIVFLSETKTRGTPSVPGFVAINNSKSNHGGIVALVKARIYPKIRSIDVGTEGVVSLELSCVPGLRLIGIYNEPTDSLYFRPTTLASISAHVSCGKSCVVVGDMNARFGDNIHNVVREHPGIEYNVIDQNVNDNGKTLARICLSCDLLPVNNLRTPITQWNSKLTYRKRNNWISEVDHCLIPRGMVDAIQSFTVTDDLSMPSDHAPMSVSFNFSSLSLYENSELVERSALLGAYPCGDSATLQGCKKPIPFRRIDKEGFTSQLQDMPPPELDISRYQESLNNFEEIIYNVSNENQRNDEIPYTSQDKQNTRWKRILEAEDSKSLWRGIDWNGEFREVESKERPSEAAFQEHMERLLNPVDAEPLQYPDENGVSIPALDEPFGFDELNHVVHKQMKPDKSCGPNGNAPGTLKLLPLAWLLFVLSLINAIFLSGTYPHNWSISKLIMLFKKGLPMDCGNYRGIGIINALAKCYEYMLNNRLTKWYIPCREQAGAQVKRGCIELIVTLRLIIDRCVRRKEPLFISFIDFSKAYDRVPRTYLLNLLKSLGCGFVMLSALTSLFSVTQFLLGATVITAVIGVKQGSPTSCFLFILFVDEFIKLVKERSGLDGFLQWLHLLMLMDDTVLLATSRERLIEKLKLLVWWCDKSGMVINEDKTQFMAFVTTVPGERKPIVLKLHHGVVWVRHCSEYKYLGAIFTSDGKLSSSLDKHCVAKQKDINKLVIFLEYNKNAPFKVKKTVVEACFNASFLYGCEAWLGAKPTADMKSMYMKAIKMLLGVRHSTPNELCLIESGYPSLEAAIHQRQHRFFERMKAERSDMSDDPLMFALKITERDNKELNRCISEILANNDPLMHDNAKRKESILSSTRTKTITYREINPTLTVHPIYKSTDNHDDDFRTAFTRLRLSSHRLRIETGRWTRTPRDERVCQCGEGVQTEKHVICDCVLVTNIRESFNSSEIDFEDFMTSEKSKQQLAMVMNILSFYENL